MMKAKIVLFLVILGCSQLVMAESADSTKMRPQFALEYTGELQTDFKATKRLTSKFLCLSVYH